MKTSLPLRTVSGDNSREHFRKKAARAKAHRFAAKWAVNNLYRGNAAVVEINSGLLVTLTRVAPKPLDSDGNASGMKHIRDGIADAFGLRDDSDPRITWAYAQRKGGVRVYAVEIEITARAHCPTCGAAVSATNNGVNP